MDADIAPILAPETNLRVRHRCRFNGGRRTESANVYSDDLPSRSAWKIVPASSRREVIGSLKEGEGQWNNLMTTRVPWMHMPAIERLLVVGTLLQIGRPMTEPREYPVEIEDAAGGLKCIRDSREAVASLTIDFPKGRSDAGKAKKVCLRAVSGAVTGERAAAAYRVAAKSAGILRE
jgi:hypothetical protein